MATIDFGGIKEDVVTRDEFPVSKALEVLKDEVERLRKRMQVKVGSLGI